jgi:threonine dehydrogenase-like Zn-dependent dehydrogenase
LTVSRSQPPVADRASDASGPVAAALEQLLESLRAEGDALIGGDVGLLGAAVHHKERTLRRLVGGLGSADRAELRRAVRLMRDLNERNARLLAARIHVNRARIESLLGAINGGTLYSADGHAASAETRGRQRGVRA